MLPPITRETQVHSLQFAAFSSSAEEDVPVIDNSVGLDNGQGAQATFTPPAIENHLDPGGLERLEHGLIERHVDLHAKPGNLHLKRLGGEAAAVAEGLEPHLVDGAAAALPVTLGSLQHADRTTHIELSTGTKPGDLSVKVDPGTLLVDEGLEAMADAILQLVCKRQVLAAPAGVKQPEVRFG